MGHGNSKSASDSSDDSSNGEKSRRERLKEKLHLHRHRQGSGSASKLLRQEDFAGIALIRIISVLFLYPFFVASFLIYIDLYVSFVNCCGGF